ncbi:HEPN domain-containing protein, partial [Mycolicibacterium sp.]|uniref:HEPN domain-containing protein n=1 Tax=Mycolicibacterium sp. TaxID=2320850 RepID=UPI0037C92D15
PRQLASLHMKVFGENVLNKCRWNRRSNPRVKEELASLVSLRGSIAHTGKTPGALHLKHVRDWRDFVLRLATHLDKHTIDWVDRTSL